LVLHYQSLFCLLLYLRIPAYVSLGLLVSAYATANWLHKATFPKSPLRNTNPEPRRCVWT
jgi:hypothetical protein